MSWAKFIGGAVGAAMGGPIGAGIGVAFGAGFDQQESEREDARDTNESASFHTRQIGNVLCVTSRIVLPEGATRALVKVGHRGRFLKTFVEPFANDDEDFVFGIQIVDRAVSFDLPLYVLSIDRCVETVISVAVLVLREEEPAGGYEIPVKVNIGYEAWSTIRWMYPVVDLISNYALRSGPWNAAKVQMIHAIFNDLVGGHASEAEVLEQRLRLQARPAMEECLTALGMRFDADDLAEFVLTGVAVILEAFGPAGISVPSEIQLLGRKLRVHPSVLVDVMQQLYPEAAPEHDDEEEDDEEKDSDEMRWACGIMEVHAGADRGTVQKAWRKKISDLHPDKYADLPDVVQNVIKEKAQEVNRARDILLR